MTVPPRIDTIMYEKRQNNYAGFHTFLFGLKPTLLFCLLQYQNRNKIQSNHANLHRFDIVGTTRRKQITSIF